MNEKISAGNKYLYATVGSEWMACQYSVISENAKFLAGKSSIPLKYHFDTSTVFFCILECIYIKSHENMWNDSQTEDVA